MKYSHLPLGLLSLLFLVACGNGADDGVCAEEERDEPVTGGDVLTGDSETLRLALVTLDPTVPDLGENEWTVEVRDSGDIPVEGCTIEVEPWMPDHGHGSTDISAVELGAGEYSLTPVEFVMPGYWEVALSITCGEDSDNLLLKLCIEG